MPPNPSLKPAGEDSPYQTDGVEAPYHRQSDTFPRGDSQPSIRTRRLGPIDSNGRMHDIDLGPNFLQAFAEAEAGIWINANENTLPAGQEDVGQVSRFSLFLEGDGQDVEYERRRKKKENRAKRWAFLKTLTFKIGLAVTLLVIVLAGTLIGYVFLYKKGKPMAVE